MAKKNVAHCIQSGTNGSVSLPNYLQQRLHSYFDLILKECNMHAPDLNNLGKFYIRERWDDPISADHMPVLSPAKVTKVGRWGWCMIWSQNLASVLISDGNYAFN